MSRNAESRIRFRKRHDASGGKAWGFNGTAEGELSAGRKRKQGERWPNGRLKPNARGAKQLMNDIGGVAPAQVRRLLDRAMEGLRDSVWGTVLGQLYAQGAIRARQFEAGKRWANLQRLYCVAIEAKHLRTAYLPVASENSVEPEQSRRIVDILDRFEDEDDRKRRHIEGYEAALAVLRDRGAPVESRTRAICEGNGLSPAGMEHMIDALKGLDALAAHWKLED